MASPYETEDLLPSIQQFIGSIKPTLQAARSQNAVLEMVTRLEETDDNFHRYDLVKYVRGHIEEALGPLIEEEIERRSLNMQGKSEEEAMVKIITDHIINDESSLDLLNSLKHSTKDAVERLIQIFDVEHHPVPNSTSDNMTDMFGTTGLRSPKRNSFCLSDNSSLDSSFNQGSFTFMSLEHFTTIADKLSSDKPIEVRRETLRGLCKLPLSDIVACEHWDSLQSSLLTALSDSDDVLAETSLDFHAKMLSSNSHHVMREVYTSLVEHLTGEFTNARKRTYLLRDGLDVSHHDMGILLKKFRLMNDFDLEIPTYWVRFPDRFLDDVIESTINLLATVPHGCRGSISQVLTPLHCIAVIDPRASWFRKWMHGNYGRMAVIRHLERNRSLVEVCVQQCMELVSSSSKSKEVASHIREHFDRQTLGLTVRSRYTETEVKYLHLCHSISLLGCLIMYVDGYRLFPVNITDGYVTVTELLVAFVHVITEQEEPALKGQEQNAFELISLVTDTLKMLCFTKSSCSLCLCKDDIISELLRPVQLWLKRNKPCSDSRMLHIADVLSTMASWEVGRKLLLYGEKGDRFQENGSAGIHVIAEFTKKALDNKMTTALCTQPFYHVTGAFLYVCRQLYSTCEGLLVLNSYGLHHLIANCWRQVCREVELVGTPTPGDEVAGYIVDDDEDVASSNQLHSKTQEADALQLWERMLIDNLLNFASTPKGLLLLQETGAISECIAYMYNRSARKLQVSKTEKFGYGSMVTQVAATAPGIIALQKTGFIQTVVRNLWSLLECSNNGQPVIRPSPIPAEPIDRLTHKYFVRMTNLLSAFPAVYEILAGKSLAKKDASTLGDAPSDILGMMERLIMVDSDAKINTLFNYEQSRIFGLRLLTVMTSCLDTMLLLESQYHIWDMLLKGQHNNHNRESIVTIDMLSVERNHLLVRTSVIGGPTERILPPHSLLSQANDPYHWPLFSKLSVPKEYTPSITRSPSINQESELRKFLSSNTPVKTTAEAKIWLSKCQAAFVTCLTKRPLTLTNRVLADLLEQTISVQLQIPENEVFLMKPCKVSDSVLKASKLPALYSLGIKMVIRYGQHLKLLSNSNESTENLSLLLKMCRYYLSSQQRSIHSMMRCLEGDYSGHDWFASTVFLLFSGNREKAWNLLHKCFSILPSGYLSMARLHASVHLPYDMAASGIPPVYSRTSYNVELILQTEVPHVYSAFRISGFTPSQICLQWLRQCFWNYLDWLDINHYIALCIVKGTDYQVYMCVAILMFLQHKILLSTQKQELQVFLKENGIDGFHVGQHFNYMQSLEKKYRRTVLPDMSNSIPV